MDRRAFGATGLQVSAVGFGAGHIDDGAMTDGEAAALLGAVLDAGVNVIDTARSYGSSEERIGRHLAGRRAEFVLSTKVGYGVDGCADWTAECVRRGIDDALGRLRTDYIDIVHLHSCPRAVLESAGVAEAVVAAVAAGKVRVAAYSGDNADVSYAVGCGAFGSVQTSASILDVWSAREIVPRALEAGLGVIAKRPLGNAAWRYSEPPAAQDVAEYWRRWSALDLPFSIAEMPAVALRYAVFHLGIDCAIVGTRSAAHLSAAIEACERGPLDDERRKLIECALDRRAASWSGIV